MPLSLLMMQAPVSPAQSFCHSFGLYIYIFQYARQTAGARSVSITTVVPLKQPAEKSLSGGNLSPIATKRSPSMRKKSFSYRDRHPAFRTVTYLCQTSSDVYIR